MRSRLVRITVALMTGAAVILTTGCAGTEKLQTEPGYAPTQVAVGEVISYNQAQGIKNQDLVKLFTKFIEESFYEEDVPYIARDELDETPFTPEKTVMMNMEINIQSGTRMGTDVLVTYTLKRRSDGYIWSTGSARTSDLPNHEGALQDLTSGLKFAATACALKVRKAMEEARGGTVDPLRLN